MPSPNTGFTLKLNATTNDLRLGLSIETMIVLNRTCTIRIQENAGQCTYRCTTWHAHSATGQANCQTFGIDTKSDGTVSSNRNAGRDKLAMHAKFFGLKLSIEKWSHCSDEKMRYELCVST